MSAIDSQSVKISSFIFVEKGIDGHKKINGRKRHIAVDVLGLPLAFFVSAANVYDGIAGIELFPQLDLVSKRLELLRICGYTVEATKKPETVNGPVPQTGCWQVERSFGWFNFFRRLSKDYEKTVEYSIAFM